MHVDLASGLSYNGYLTYRGGDETGTFGFNNYNKAIHAHTTKYNNYTTALYQNDNCCAHTTL